MNEVRRLLESRYAGLHAHIERTLAESEARYNHDHQQPRSDFLREHTQHTAAIAHTLALREGVDLPARIGRAVPRRRQVP